MTEFNRKLLESNAKKCGIPEYMIGALVRYVADRLQPGDFLTAVLSNDLMGACGRADDTNRRYLFAYCQFLYNHAPSDCWGSAEKVKKWLD